MTQRDPFDVLGVSPDVSAKELHAAWRRLCAIYHPDRFADASVELREESARRMAEVNACYRVALQRMGERPPAPIGGADAPVAAQPLVAEPPPNPPPPDEAPRDEEPVAPSAPPRRARRTAWLVAAVAALLVLNAVTLGALLLDSGGDGREPSRPAGRSDSPIVEVSPVAAPAASCPPDGDVLWRTEVLSARAVSTSVGQPPTYSVRIAGRVENATESTVNVKPFVELFDAADRKSALPVIVHFVDRDGNGLTAPPPLEPGKAYAWEGEAVVPMQQPGGPEGGRPVRAEPVTENLTAWHGAACEFSAVSVGERG
jgi:hypothetical protein